MQMQCQGSNVDNAEDFHTRLLVLYRCWAYSLVYAVLQNYQLAGPVIGPILQKPQVSTADNFTIEPAICKGGCALSSVCGPR